MWVFPDVRVPYLNVYKTDVRPRWLNLKVACFTYLSTKVQVSLGNVFLMKLAFLLMDPAPVNDWIWVSFKLEEFEGWPIAEYAIDRQKNPIFGIFEVTSCKFRLEHLRHGLRVPDFRGNMSTLPFILHLRHVCETIFDVMLSAYICGLEAYQKRPK